jgi:GTPase
LHSRKQEIIENPEQEEMPVYKIDVENLPWRIVQRNDGWLIKGRKIERFAARTDFDNEEGVRRLRDIMKKMGIVRELERRGIQKGHIIDFGHHGQITY